MAIERSVTVYDGPGGPFEGMAVADTAWDGPCPGVMIVPNVLGTKEADFRTAERIAGLGYAAFVADLYGQGNRATREDESPTRFMDALNADRGLLRDRLHASLSAMQSLDAVDPDQAAAIGYCFGGKSVLDLARSGARVRGVVSFHGIYDAPPFPNANEMTAKILVCHGWDDPLAPPSAVDALAKELTDAGVDWQLHAYGHTGHGFTDKSANMPERGVVYQPDADRRSWKAMTDFLAEIFE
ncbi:dienelactone hydrolase family protein [Parasphingopyxis algicola]|uniref:dienelactone hydrolase family protein n=1 Tax=Parasphingopyxis algicola TaxID=2026624 RepID=UPI0015A09979|nr:dienelactone hydrolase family protein [Parasphingopyxis algicola]QLC25488.1 dienelactone hydrolase family protein [Parasphingopyxis algicola]